VCKSGDLGVGTPRPPVEARRIDREVSSRLCASRQRNAAPQTPLRILVVFSRAYALLSPSGCGVGSGWYLSRLPLARFANDCEYTLP
jgi:hypothetical protein